MTDDLEKQADETAEPEADPGVTEPENGGAGGADAETSVEPDAEESEPSA